MSDNNNQKTTVEINRRLVYINSASSIAARVLNIFVLVWMYEYLLRRISPEEFAIYPVVASIMVFGPLFSTVFVGGVIRHATDAYALGDDKRVRQILSSIIPILGGSSLVLLVLGLTFSWHINEFLNVPDHQLWDARMMMALLILVFVLDTALLPYSLGFHVRQRYVMLNIINVSTDLLRIAIMFVLLVGVSPRVLWIVISMAIARIIYIAVVTVMSRNMMPELRFDFSLFGWQTARRIMSFGIWSTLAHLSHMIFLSAGTIVLNRNSTPLDVTNFHVGNTIHKQVFSMMTLASAPVMPVLTAMNALGEEKRLANAYLRGGRFALWVMMMVATPLIIFSPEFINLYIGNTYSDTALVIMLIMGTYPFTASNTMLSKLASATDYIRPFAIAAISISLLNLAIMIYITGWMNMGAVGVAASIFFTTAVSQVIIFWPLGLRYAKISFGRFALENIIPGIVPALCGLLVWLPLKLYHSPATWLELTVFVGAGMMIYGAALLLLLVRYEADLLRMFLEPFRKLALKAVR